MKLTIISDTHNRHAEIEMPAVDPATGKAGDLLVHCGDATVRGEVDETLAFADWLAERAKDYAYGALFVPGNHDLIFRDRPQFASELMRGNVHVETHGPVDVGGRRIFASSWTPSMRAGRPTRWAFHYDRGSRAAGLRWADVPDDAEILVTHGPPLGILDDSGPEYLHQNAGCHELLAAVARLNLRGALGLHCFGHIHTGHGRLRWNQQDAGRLLFVNAAVVGNDYEPAGRPQEVTL